jgi:hypothetical protein
VRGEEEFEGEVLAPLLTRPGAEALTTARVGCQAYRQDPDGLSPAAQGVLFSQRSALWLDLYEVRGDAAMLVRAREAANRSWANAPSGHCSAVYDRLRKLEAVDDEKDDRAS